MSDARHRGFSVFGIGAAACVACCAGPVLAVLGDLSLPGLASTLGIDAAGLVAAAAFALAAFLVIPRRRAQAACQTTPPEPVPAAGPARKLTP